MALHLFSHARASRIFGARVFTIMAHPRSFEREHSLGTIPALQPTGAERRLLDAALTERSRGALFAGRNNTDQYERAITARWTQDLDTLRPGTLRACTRTGFELVRDGDYLCCACGAGQECHRYWAAPFLRQAGWTVTTDHPMGK